MPNLLHSLEVSEVSLVDRPAGSEMVDGKLVPRATIAIWKRNSDVDKHDPNPVQDPAGRFGLKDSASATVDADEKTKAAQAVGSADNHKQAAIAHEHAMNLHLAEVGTAGDTAQAQVHQTQAMAHDAAAKYHQAEGAKVENDDGAPNPDDAWNDGDEFCKAITGVSKDGKTQGGVEYPKSDFAFTPDDEPSHWKLRLTSTPGGPPDARIVGAAVAALGKGFRGKRVQIPADALAGVKSKVRSAWLASNKDKGAEDMPSVLKINKGDNAMTLEEIQKRQDAQEAELAVLKAANAALVSENETVLKMSKKERKTFAGMDEEKRKEYLAGDAEKRKAMLEACDKAAKAKEPVEPDADDEEEKEAARKVAKRLSESEENVAKALERVAKTEAELATIRKREQLTRFTKMAEDTMPHTPGTPVEKGTRLMQLADAFGEDSEFFKAELLNGKAADTALAIQFREVGRDGGAVPVEKAIDAKVSEIRKRDGIDESHAMAKAMEEAPALFVDYDNQKRHAVRA